MGSISPKRNAHRAPLAIVPRAAATGRAAPPLRLVIRGERREVRSFDEARGFLREHDADALADVLMWDLDEATPAALATFQARLKAVSAAL